MRWLDSLLDRVTMYRLLVYYLAGLLGVAVILAGAGKLSYSPMGIIFSTGFFVVACWITNDVFAKIFNAAVNVESSLITALILALIITPYRNPHDLILMTAASGLAISSKYILAIRRKHLFNPAAIAVALTAIGAGQAASWWVGGSVMLPYVLAGGLILTRKLNRFWVIVAFLTAAALTTAAIGLVGGTGLSGLEKLAIQSPLFFFAFVMLTEPATLPPTAGRQTWYAVLAGALIPPQIHFGSLYSTPELALVTSNLFSYLVSPKFKLAPTFKHKVRLAPDAFDFVFEPGQHFQFEPGQYMEWTLRHDKPDSRGNRRYLTLASSPTEPELRIGVKFYPNGSSFKHALSEITKHSQIMAAQLSGDFVMPKDQTQKLAFIAGGIGVTPYRSMIKYLTDKNERRDVKLLYSEKNHQELAYTEVFEAARKQLGIETVYFLTGQTDALRDSRVRSGLIDAAAIKRELPDYLERRFYISGPRPMVTAIKHTLGELGVPARQIKTDYFPGYGN